MAALNFPASPTVGQIYTANGRSWKWDGASWISANQITSIGVTGSTLTIYGSPIAHPDATSLTFANSVALTAASTKTLTLNGGAGSNGLVLDASNNVGIGAAPSYKLDVLNNSTNIIARLSSSYAYGTAIQLANSSTGGGTWSLYSFGQSNGEGAGNFGIANVAGTKLTLDSSGNLGLGVTPSAWDSGQKVVQISNGSFYGYSSGTVVIQNAYYNSGFKYVSSQAAAYYQQYAGAHQWYNAPSGTAGNAITFTQAMTLDASGRLLVGTTSVINLGLANFYSATNAKRCIETMINTAATSDHIAFFSSSGQAGQITVTGITTAYGTSSDYRLKENLQPIQNALSRVALLKPSKYIWKADQSEGEGFIAHELQEVVPQAVTGEKDGEQMQGVDYGKLTPLLAAAIQELTTRLEALEAKVSA